MNGAWIKFLPREDRLGAMKQSQDEAHGRSDVRTSNQLKKFPRDSEELMPTREVVPTWLDIFDESSYFPAGILQILKRPIRAST